MLPPSTHRSFCMDTTWANVNECVHVNVNVNVLKLGYITSAPRLLLLHLSRTTLNPAAIPPHPSRCGCGESIKIMDRST